MRYTASFTCTASTDTSRLLVMLPVQFPVGCPTGAPVSSSHEAEEFRLPLAFGVWQSPTNPVREDTYEYHA